MGDVPEGSQPPGNYPIPPQTGRPTPFRLSSPELSELRDIGEQYYEHQAAVFQHGSQASFQIQRHQQFNPPYQTRQNLSTPPQTNQAISQPNTAQAQLSSRDSSFSMASLGAVLPDSPNIGQGFAHQSSQRFPFGLSQAALSYQLQQGAQFPGQMNIAQPNNPAGNIQYAQQYPEKYAHQAPPLLQPSDSSQSQQFVASQSFIPTMQSQQMSPYYYQSGPSQYSPQAQGYPTSQPPLYGTPYGSRVNLSGEGGLSPQHRRSGDRSGPVMQSSGSLARAGGTASIGGQTSILRGPPRKPKQSGHALWVGNLPSGAKIVELKDHFSRDATDDILSVFLISKSNCAFVNYKTEESCSAAMSRFHESRFRGVRLVCRLRRSSIHAGTGVSAVPVATSGSQLVVAKPALGSGSATLEPDTTPEIIEDSSSTPHARDKFFIVKSLTVEDLELSVKNGIWATQSHNEEALNKAYKAAENVYLIFSANKSGEYFGYARMTSAIDGDPAVAVEFTPKARAVDDSDLLKAIPTEATEFAPKGRIIDDSARGTIFWEAEYDEADDMRENEEQHSDHSDQELDSNTPTNVWGKPFKVEWLSTNRIPFYQTRGLRNPWNSNREVKVARDGTELENSVGRRLIQMFHREAGQTVPTIPTPIPPIMGAYHQMRPY